MKEAKEWSRITRKLLSGGKNLLVKDEISYDHIIRC